MKKLVITAAVLASVAFIDPGRFLQAEELTRHTVEKGDTLWDLSEGYLEDPFLWPNIWKLNPFIADPHWIFPGQVVRIPLAPPAPAPMALPAKPGEADDPTRAALALPDPADLPSIPSRSGQPLAIRTGEEPGPGVSPALGQDELELSRQYDRGIGMITRELPAQGRVLGTRQGWRHAGGEELILVQAPGAQPGQRFGVYRDLGKVPAPTFRGTSPGHLLADIAIIEIVRADAAGQQAVVSRSFAELQADDLLGPVPEPPVVPVPLPAAETLSFTGTVVALHHQRQLAGSGDIVYLDQGGNQGLVPGLRLAVRSAAAQDPPRTGELMVLRVTADRAAALVTERSSHAVRTGDQVGPNR